MATADRNILRLATFEIIYLETPYRIAIDEGIELAKRFGSSQSAQFINGVLDRVWQENANRSQSDDPQDATQRKATNQDVENAPTKEMPSNSDRSV